LIGGRRRSNNCFHRKFPNVKASGAIGALGAVHARPMTGIVEPNMGVTTMNWVDLLGYIASASVLATFCMSTIVSLRTVAICSNILFATFGALAHVYPVLVLHLILLPVNVFRLAQALSATSQAGGRLLKAARAWKSDDEPLAANGD
jgi:hypothetical protein